MPSWKEPAAEAMLPGLLRRAHALQAEAAKLGFDWPEAGPVWDKLDEELEELREAAATSSQQHTVHELGDVLFSVVNLARFLNVDPEQALEEANQRFCGRLDGIQQLLDAAGRGWDDCSLDELESYWQQAKRAQAKP